ncbi:TetR/AcrR family transcriptional regulator [Salegentibacter maritimus]|uniref:TetR/AcrR family transcriptional regulator n=1 Tax=Salegentibacter maritimus TaxID=2794347 RepID=UPI0018E47663|nr:TetR/AcrR family transcriptional regulator [Salegentibacter maritimus]MBI6116811.1 TetR/AcrR family transcriptional regulator [Salegentibacter maritimus]
MAKTKGTKTKEKILKEAIKMYNEHGSQNTTGRHIAAQLGISHGNLDYYFKNKEAILLAIYKKMRKEMSTSYLLKDEYGNSFEHFHRLLLHLEQFQYTFRFFNLDVLEINRSNPEVSKMLHETLEMRKLQVENFFKEFIDEGFIEKSESFSFERLQHTIRIIITFWLSQKEVLAGYKYSEVGEMTHHIWELLIPYMTKTGSKEYKRLIDQFGFTGANEPKSSEY